MRVQHAAKGFRQLTAFGELELFPFFDRRDFRREHAAACLHEPGALQRHRRLHAHSPEHRQEALLDELKRRSHRVVRAAFDAQCAGGFRMKQSGQQRLQHERRAAAGADGKAVVACRDLAGLENEFCGAHLGPFDLRAANFRRRFHAGEVLTHQTRLRPLPANVRHLKCPPRDQRQRQRRPQQLPATGFAGDGEDGGVGFAHCESRD